MATPEFVIDQLEVTEGACRTCEHFLGFTAELIKYYEAGQVTEEYVRDRMDLASSFCFLGLRARDEIIREDEVPEREQIPTTCIFNNPNQII